MAITSIVTLNQLINWYQQFQINHLMLKDFGFGETYDIGTSRQMTFPYMWVTLNDDNNIATGSNIKSAIPEFSFNILFMDKINIQENYLDTNGFPSDNSQEILSDCVQYLQDLVVFIQNEWQQYGVLISQDTNFFPVVDETPDKATGISARIVIKTRQVNCIIPESIFISPTPTPTNTLTPTPTYTPTPTPTCIPVTQYIQAEVSGTNNIKLSLFDTSGFTGNANAICDYVVSGVCISNGAFINWSTTIQNNDHNHTFDSGGVNISNPTITSIIPSCNCVTVLVAGPNAQPCIEYEIQAGGSGSNFYWINCDGTPDSIYLPGSNIDTICAQQNSGQYDGGGSFAPNGPC